MTAPTNVPSSAVFHCDLATEPAPLRHFWEHTVGSDHATMALRADWRAQLARAREDLGVRHVRFHGILSDDVGTLLCEENTLIYSFFNADNIIDYLLSIGMRPFVELSFMPATLSSGTTTVFKYRGNVTPPRDLLEWETLIKKLVGHWVARYGLAEVRNWFFEIWNEPNLQTFWTGSKAEYFELYRHSVAAIKAVDDRLRVGGPATADNAWITDFLDFCHDQDVAADFVSTHQYPTDAFGKPGDDTETELSLSRRSVMRDEARAVHAQARGKPLYYTEWSSSSNPRDSLHDDPYAAAFVVKTILEANGLVEGYSYWTFSDLFEENYLPSVPFHGGFGLLNLQGIAKPTYRAYELLHGIGTKLVSTEGSHPTVDVWLVTGGDTMTILCTNWALPRHPIGLTHVSVIVDNAGEPGECWIERIDETHANAKGTWRALHEPEYPSEKQLQQMIASSAVPRRRLSVRKRAKALEFQFDMPAQAVAAVTMRQILIRSG